MKKKKYVIVIIIAITLILSSCEKSTGDKDDYQNELAKFEDLKVGMNVEEIYNKVGKPIDDIGSGVPILIYEIKKTGEKELQGIKLNFDLDQHLTKVTLLDEKREGQILVGD